jgi:hypothetical protein
MRLSNRVQLTTDNYKVYLNAVDYAFGVDVDFATLEKHYVAPKSTRAAALRYVPNKIAGMKRRRSRATLTASTSRPATSKDRTSRCECTCAASRV